MHKAVDSLYTAVMATKKATIELEAFTNELGQTYSTIFDPKPAIDKEVRDFVREFEVNKGSLPTTN